MVKKTPAYQNRLKALQLERTGGITTKKKGHKQMDKYEFSRSFEYHRVEQIWYILL